MGICLLMAAGILCASSDLKCVYRVEEHEYVALGLAV